MTPRSKRSCFDQRLLVGDATAKKTSIENSTYLLTIKIEYIDEEKGELKKYEAVRNMK